MRTLILLLVFGLGLFSNRFAADCQAQPQVTLAWSAVANPYVSGYYLVWGTSSGVYSATNTYPSTQTNGTIGNLSYGVQYYIAVAAFATNGEINPVGPFSAEIMYITNAPSVVVASGGPGNGPPTPPPPPGPGKPGGTKSNNSGNGGSAAVGPHSAAAASTAAASTNIVQAQIWGIPPILSLSVSNSQPYLSIGGTQGATFAVQWTTDISTPSSWATITNVTMTNAQTDTNLAPGQVQDAIDLAYVPSVQSFPLPASTNAGMQHFRVLMSNDYPILAGIVLKPKGYTPRLILVNMPGLTTPDDCCYVAQAASFIHYNQTNSVLQLEGAGSTIRQIATTLANNLKLDWTTASEFVYSNGMGQILATVVESDPPSSDPVAGTTPTSSIVINF